MNEEELKKIEARIKRFGKVEPVKEEISQRPSRQMGNFERNKNFNIRNLPKPRNNNKEGKYLQINKFNFAAEEGRDKEKVMLNKAEKKKEDYFIKLRENPVFNKKRLTIFGVNLMSNKDLEEYFGTAKIVKIYWMSDYSCVVEFDSEEIALGVLGELTDFKYDENKSDIENFDWRKSKDYRVMEIKLDLSIRVSEENDTSKKAPKSESQFYQFQKKRNKIERIKGMNNDGYQEKSYYKELMEEKQKLNENQRNHSRSRSVSLSRSRSRSMSDGRDFNKSRSRSRSRERFLMEKERNDN